MRLRHHSDSRLAHKVAPEDLIGVTLRNQRDEPIGKIVRAEPLGDAITATAEVELGDGDSFYADATTLGASSLRSIATATAISVGSHISERTGRAVLAR